MDTTAQLAMEFILFQQARQREQALRRILTPHAGSSLGPTLGRLEAAGVQSTNVARDNQLEEEKHQPHTVSILGNRHEEERREAILRTIMNHLPTGDRSWLLGRTPPGAPP
jgi:hypothetical protein